MHVDECADCVDDCYMDNCAYNNVNDDAQCYTGCLENCMTCAALPPPWPPPPAPPPC